MRVLIFAFGTRGDIQPYLALAQRLVEGGHAAVLSCPEAYRDDVETLGVGFQPMATEMDELMRAGMGVMSGSAFSASLIRSMTGAMRTSLEEQWDAARRVKPTVIVAHPKALGGYHVAQRLGVPFVASLPLPFMTPTAAFPVPFLAADLPGWVNRRSYAFNRFSAVAYGGMINRFRREDLGLGRMSRVSDYLRHPDGSTVPVLYGFSGQVVPVPPDYPSSVHVTGYWFLSESTPWSPTRELAGFLDSRRPVVYVGFGSMGFGRDADRRGRIITEAIEKAGVSAVVATGWGGVDVPSSDRIFVVKEAPHEGLFPRVDAVVHHGGAGTTAAGLRAGRPTLICPFLGDQPFWGKRVLDLGVGPAPLRLHRATSDELAGRLRALVSDGAYRAAATALGRRIRDEDGTGEAVRVLESISERVPAW